MQPNTLCASAVNERLTFSSPAAYSWRSMADRIDWPKPLSSRWNPARAVGWSLDLTARKRRIAKSGLSASPAFAAARAWSSTPSKSKAAANQKWAAGALRLASMLRRSQHAASASAPSWNPPPLVTHAFSGRTAISGTRPQFLVPHVAFAHASYSLVRPRREYPRAALITRPTNCRSPLRHSGDAHALIHTLTSGEISVARHANSVAADREGRIEHKARLRGGPRLIE